MNKDLESQNAIITGASHGIGRAIALGMAAAGARVALAARKEHDLDTVARDIRDGGGEAIAVRCHMGSEEDVRGLVTEATARFGSIDLPHHASRSHEIRCE